MGNRQPGGEELFACLRNDFGHDRFRPGQERAIRTLLGGRDVLYIQPTGAGKSLVYQVASQFLPGITLVVSPLIALMKDQADSLEAQGVEAGVIHSGQSARQIEESLASAREGETRILYVTPERLENPEFVAQFTAGEISLVAVDEAHCISEWGYDFRPAYLALPHSVERLGRPPVLALTATATPWVRQDIVERLDLRGPRVIVSGVDRPNLFFEVRTVRQEEEDFSVLRTLFQGEDERYPPDLAERLAGMMQGSGIIYTATTRAAEETAAWLREWGVEAGCYHGQLKKADRDRIQEAFMAGELRVIAATNAFGLGIDKPDVRFVIHRDVPASVEEYYQEAGRAGRDGEPARCVLIYRPADLGRAAFLGGSSRVAVEDLRKIRKALRSGAPITPADLRAATGLGKAKAARAIELLTAAGMLDTTGDSVRLRVEDFDPERISLECEERRKRYERSRLEMVRGYAELWECRRRYLLNYFGEETEFENCDWCDNDLRTDLAPEVTEPDAFQPGAQVRHREWGEGRVSSTEGDTLTVDFDTGERKVLSREVVEREGLLEVTAPPSAEDPSPEPPEPRTWLDAVRVGDHVTHSEYGSGEVTRVTDEGVTVLFEASGYHTLAKDVVMERGLLAPA